METIIINRISNIIFAFGLFFIGIIGLSQYTSSYSGKSKFKLKGKSGIAAFFKAVGLTCLVSDGGKIVAITAGTNYMSSTINFKIAALSVLGAVTASTSSSFFIIINNNIIVLLMVGIGGIGYFFLKNKNIYAGKFLLFTFYLGLLLFGMEQMKESFSFISESPMIQKYITHQDSFIFFILNGLILSIVLQSGGTVSFLAIALQRSELLNYDQTIFVLAGSCLGSSIRGQVFAFAFAGKSKQIMSLFSNVKFLGFILFFIFIIIFKSILGTFNNLSQIPVLNNIAFDYAVASVLADSLSVLILIPFIPKLKILYEKLLPAKKETISVNSLHIKNLVSKPISEWIKPLREEYMHILLNISSNFFQLINTQNCKLVDLYCTSTCNIIEQIKDYYLEICSYDKMTGNNSVNFDFERLLYLEKINKSLFEYCLSFQVLKKNKNFYNILDNSNQHIHFVLCMLCEYIDTGNKNDLALLQKTINDKQAKRREYFTANLILNKNDVNTNLKINYIYSYNEILTAANMLLETYLNDNKYKKN